MPAHEPEDALDPERALALAHVPADRRAALRTLWLVDERLGSIAMTPRDPTMGALRLLWWRDALGDLSTGPRPADPLLRAAMADVLPAGVDGASIAGIEAGWAAVLQGSEPDADDLCVLATERGARLFALSAAILGAADAAGMAVAGRIWSLADVGRRGAASWAQVQAAAGPLARLDEVEWPMRLRPLGMLAMLARRDLRRDGPERQGSPARVGRMLYHRWTGR